MTSRRTKAKKGLVKIADLIHLNTMRLTFKLWAHENTNPAFRKAKQKREIVEIRKILKSRGAKFRETIKRRLSTKRKRPTRKR